MAWVESLLEKDMQNALSEKSFQFLAELEKHTSDKAWFEEHKTAYKEYLYDPLYELAERLGPVILSLDAGFEVTPRKVISRIYKDTRFSRDKAFYKNNMSPLHKKYYDNILTLLSNSAISLPENDGRERYGTQDGPLRIGGFLC